MKLQWQVTAPRPTRTVTSSTSIAPAPGSALHGRTLRWWRTVDADEPTSTRSSSVIFENWFYLIMKNFVFEFENERVEDFAQQLRPS